MVLNFIPTITFEQLHLQPTHLFLFIHRSGEDRSMMFIFLHGVIYTCVCTLLRWFLSTKSLLSGIWYVHFNQYYYFPHIHKGEINIQGL